MQPICLFLKHFIQHTCVSVTDKLTSQLIDPIEHIGTQTKMINIFQISFSKAFSWKKNVCWFRLHWNMYMHIQLMIRQHCFGLWLGADELPNHYQCQWYCGSLSHICSILIHCGLVMPYGDTDLGQHGLLPVRCQAITWTNADLLSNRSLGTNSMKFEILIFSFTKNAFQNFGCQNDVHFVQGEMS